MIDATQADVTTLSQGLAARAATEDLLDIGYGEVDSPFGALLACVTPAGVVRVAFADEDHDAILAGLARQISPRILRAPRRVEALRRELGEYFDGRRQRFDIAVDWRLSAGFRRLALAAVSALPYGTTATYTEVAMAAGNPKAVRAAGSACATNPVPIVVPCHRVVRSGGGLGGYLGGLDAKRALLALELQGVGPALLSPGPPAGTRRRSSGRT